ncbi:cytochrome c oxidase accessory protein FixG [Sinobacterium caligoides]|uniref:Cytochrome c oxidase accessory protein FixG n=1 Tax=Sinobacterium caligoides TaxID=933926 RepID=A0A3N2DZS2_9GAMM|nr:cytochrome c oxidase accessory protein CcoG [Sinobacterium caligoides]ROS05267.1 cytochrome c oxidase accessory protein FixG [Sinobacterium caligoides]
MNKDDQINAVEVDPFEHLHTTGKVYPRSIEGFYQKLRVYTGWPLLLGFFFLPWLNWDGRQIVLFDLPARQFHILGITFWPQDFYLLGWLLIIAALSLFAVTMYAGRVWCGYTCPQTVWTSIFMWAEELAEGSRNQRIKLDKQPMSVNKFTRKLAKHAMWIGFSFITGATFVGYFTPIKQLVPDLFLADAELWSYAWVMFFLLATYINAGWLREAVCMHICPYARFQSVMFDSDTLVVSYDTARGEPRGARKREKDELDPLTGEKKKGDCIDCKLCVQVCPTGIDIRNGLQYQCITCALCIDACDSIMDKMNYQRGLIRYTTENALAGKKTHLLRPRLFIYAGAITLIIALFITAIATRIPLQIDIERDRSRLFFQTNEGMIENSYTLKVINMSQHAGHYILGIEGLKGAKYIGEKEVSIESGEVAQVPVRLELDPSLLEDKSMDVTFTVRDSRDEDISAERESRFTGPSWR